MNVPMIASISIAVLLFAALLGLTYLGTAVGTRRHEIDPNCFRRTAAAEGVVYALLGLLIAFSFSDAAARFDRRRDLILEESNAISTAASRFDLLDAPQRDELRALFRGYVEARIALADTARSYADLERNQRVVVERGAAVWAAAISACRGAQPQLVQALLPPLNACFDIAELRRAVLYHHPPLLIFVMLFALALTTAYFAGQSMAGAPHKMHFHRIVFAGVVAMTMHTIIELELPRRGLITIHDSDRLLLDLVESLK